LRNRDVERVGGSEGEVEPTQNRLRCSDVGGHRLLAQRGPRRPCVEGGKAAARLIGGYISGSDTSATAEANSVAAKSLTITTGVFPRKNASARAVTASTISNATSTLASG
jgi:hypothetical protein